MKKQVDASSYTTSRGTTHGVTNDTQNTATIPWEET